MRLSTLVLLLAASASFGALHAQSNANTPVTLRAESRLVVLDVVVTDRAGNPVPDLTESDFAVFEDKRPQPIRNFESVQDHMMPAGAEGKLLVQSSADLRKIGPAPVTVLVLDELNTKYEDMALGRHSVEEFLRHQPRILPQPITLIAVSFQHFLVLRDFTQDRDALLDALLKHRPAFPSELIRTGISGAGERMAATLACIQEIATAQAGTPGRKNLIWIGQGFPSINSALLDQNQRDIIDAALRQITGVMLHGRITLFVADAAGLQTSAQGGGSAGIIGAEPDQLEAWEDLVTGDLLFGGQFSFASLAPVTGGRAFTNRNDVDTQIVTSIDEGASYYTLAYVPRGADADSPKYRHIRVEVRRPGLSVMTRDGYFPVTSAQPPSNEVAAAAKAQTRDIQSELVNAALNPMTYDGIDLHAAKEQNGAYDLDVRSADLSWTPLANGLFHTNVTIFAVSFTPAGKVSADTSHQITGDIAQAPTPGSRARTLLKCSFEVPPTATHIRFVVRDTLTGRIGTADLNVTP